MKLTKNELRLQQMRLVQLRKYLPTLQLKKAMLQGVIGETRIEIADLEKHYIVHYKNVEAFSPLLVESHGFDPIKAVKITEVRKKFENIAGIEVPHFDSAVFAPFYYSLFESPPWVDALIAQLRSLAEANAKVEVAKEKRKVLEKELREVSIRVNLFEKVMIPKTMQHIKKIKIFLGDQQLAAVSQAKVAKSKIEERKAQAQIQKEAVHAY